MIMKSDMHLPFIGILSTLDMRRSYLECSGPTAEREREGKAIRLAYSCIIYYCIDMCREKNLCYPSVFFVLVGHYEHLIV
jgi:hypothetical protein